MKIPNLLVRKKKLRVTAARRSMSAPDEMDYEEMSEPNMKLSRALLIVLVLHVVAVAGIIAFNTIKSRQGEFPASRRTASAAPAETTPVAPVKNEQAAAPATKEERVAEPAKIPKALPAGSGESSGNFYVVAKGDNPVKIAKKLKVSESDLLTVNRIDDPRKLQIGQKLIIPAAKASKGKKSND